MGVIHGLSLNEGKLDVQLDDQIFSKDTTNKIKVKIGGGLMADVAKGMTLQVGTGLEIDDGGYVRVTKEIEGGGSAATAEVEKLKAQHTEDVNGLWNAINDYHKPFGINLSASPTLLEVGSSAQNVTLTWSYQNADIHKIASQKLNGSAVAVGTLTSTQSVDRTAHVTKTFTLEATTTKNKTLSRSASVVVNHASYYGVVDAAKTTLSATEIKALTKKLSTSKALGATSFAQNNQKVAYAYPEYFGNLASIKNSSGFEGLPGYEKKTVAVDGQNYNLYISKDAATSTDKLTFA